MAIKRKTQKATTTGYKYLEGQIFRGLHDELYRIKERKDGDYLIIRIPDSFTYMLGDTMCEMVFKPHWLSEMNIDKNLKHCWELC